ncbi:MAG: DUF2298 domain-containing protein [Chloroflexi bacterium]|nr:DUF2298 domain-containing protein [Chloroflexota bacterium]
MDTILEAIVWWVAVSALGLAALPVVFRVFGSLPSRGYHLARVSGLLLVGYTTWILTITGVLHFSVATIGLCATLVLALGAVLLSWGDGAHFRELISFFRKEWRFILTTELVFAAGFALLVVLRGFTPDIWATEKPMDFALLNSFMRYDNLLPQDPWLAGYPINYYYFGHFLAAVVTKVSGVPTGVAFNLAISMFFALAAVSCFGLVFDLVAGQGGERRRAAYLAGFLGSVLLVLAGNLYAGISLLNDPSSTLAADWWSGVGWNSSRIIVDTIFGVQYPTINEFPSFSFSLADLHAHVMVIPFSLLALSTALAILRTKGSGWVRTRFWLMPSALSLWAGVVLGSLYLINSWDFPTNFLIIGACLLLVSARSKSIRRTIPGALWILAFSVVLYLPFYLNFKSVVGASQLPLPPEIASIPLLSKLSNYIGIVIWEKTTLGDFLTIFGLFFYVAAPFIFMQGLVAATTGPKRRYMNAAILVAVIVLLGTAAVLFRFPLLGLLPPLVLLGVWYLWKAEPDGRAFAVLLGSLAFLIILACELIFVMDAFHDRMNMVFKFYYQAWIMLSVVTPVALYHGAQLLAPRIRRADGHGSRTPFFDWSHLWMGGFAALLVISMAYPVLAGMEKIRSSGGFHGLDGTTYMKLAEPSDYDAFQWLNTNVKGMAVILEASGPPYADYGRVSMFTGLASVLGWANHEGVWRAGQSGIDAELNQREQDIDTIYSTTDLNLARSLLAKYHVQYVFVGDVERGLRGSSTEMKHYPPEGLAKFSSLGEVVFHEGGTYVYRINP